jgi:hypothetical protein
MRKRLLRKNLNKNRFYEYISMQQRFVTNYSEEWCIIIYLDVHLLK